MARSQFFTSVRRILGIPTTPLAQSSLSRSYPRSIDTDFSVFREGDRAILLARVPYLTKPLKHGGRTDVARGYLNHSDIIDKPTRELIKAHKGKDHRLTHPTLEEYVSLTPRLVTPIYGADANLIVSLLDIHVSPSAESNGDHGRPLEILEAGTGHGSLTLHLARAIQAANTIAPALPQVSQVRLVQDRPSPPLAEDGKYQTGTKTNDSEDGVSVTQRDWDEWRAQRGAVIHTVDVSPKFSAHAEQIVRGFRRGIYAGNVDFYAGAVENWIKDQVQKRRSTSSSSSNNKLSLRIFGSKKEQDTVQPFLSRAILDMPSAHKRIPHVAPVMLRDGLLAVFVPSITQIGECVQLIQQERLPFVMERVVELGMGLSSGRLWDVRMTVKKSRADPNTWATAESRSSNGNSTDEIEGQEGLEEADSESAAGTATVSEEEKSTEDNVMVCRPKVGSKIVGGGFVGIWRRIDNASKNES